MREQDATEKKTARSFSDDTIHFVENKQNTETLNSAPDTNNNCVDPHKLNMKVRLT
jgi:hypothetical protein